VPDFYKKSRIATSVFNPKKGSREYDEIAVIFDEGHSKNYIALIPTKDDFDHIGGLVFTIQSEVRFVEIVEENYTIIEYKPVKSPGLLEIFRLRFWIEILSNYSSEIVTTKDSLSNDDVKSKKAEDNILDNNVLVFSDVKGNKYKFVEVCHLELNGNQYLVITDSVDEENNDPDIGDLNLYFAKVEIVDDEFENVSFVSDQGLIKKLKERFWKYYKFITSTSCPDPD
jgi:hypothetical protein